MPTKKDIPKLGRAVTPSGGAGGWVRIIAVSLSLVAFFALCYLLKGILTSLFLAFTVAYIFDPVVDFIESRQVILPNLRVPRGMAVAILIVCIMLIGSGFMSYAIPKTIDSGKRVARVLKLQYPHYQKQLESFLSEYGPPELAAFLKEEKPKATPVAEEGVPTTLKKETGPLGIVMYLKEYAPGTLQYMFDIIKKFFYSTFGLVGTIANLFTFTFVSIYLLKDYDRIVTELKTFIPPSRKERVLELMSKVDNNLRAFLRGQLSVSMILGFLYSIGLSIVGVPLAFLVGFLAGIGNMVPLLGTFIGIVLAMSLTALEPKFWSFAFVGITFAVGQFLDSTVLTPNIVGGRVGLHPVVIILSVLIWSQLLGFLGMLMAIPFTTAAMVFIGEALKEYKERILKD